METPKRRRRAGRPGREPSAGQRVSLGLRVPPKSKKALDQAAADSGRSQSQEAELRLERSFNDEHQLVEALELSYGPQLAGVLLTLGVAMKTTGRHCDSLTIARSADRKIGWRVPTPMIRPFKLQLAFWS